MFEETRDYVKQRKAFGKTVADLQVSFSLILHSFIFPGSSAGKESMQKIQFLVQFLGQEDLLEKG